MDNTLKNPCVWKLSGYSYERLIRYSPMIDNGAIDSLGDPTDQNRGIVG